MSATASVSETSVAPLRPQPGGSLGPRRVAPAGLGTLRSDTPTFAVFLIGVVILFALLTFLTALFLGPLVQGLTSHLY